MLSRMVLCLAAGLGACATSAPPGPSGAELSALIAGSGRASAPTLRAVRCEFIEEEGSEWRCRYQERASNGRWVPLETYVAVSRDGWILIDGVADPDASSPDP